MFFTSITTGFMERKSCGLCMQFLIAVENKREKNCSTSAYIFRQVRMKMRLLPIFIHYEIRFLRLMINKHETAEFLKQTVF